MFFTFSSERSYLSRVSKLLHNLGLTILLVSLVVPLLHQVINVKAQINQIDSNTKVTIEKIDKNQTREVNQMTLEELKQDTELAKINSLDKSPQVETDFKLTPQQIQTIEAKGGIFYQAGVAIVNESLLTDLGYTPAQTQTIKEMVTIYNSQTIKQVKITTDVPVQSSFLTIQAQAVCTPKIDTTWHWWGYQAVLDACGINEFKWGFTKEAAVVGLWSLTPCSWVCAVLATYRGSIVPALEYQSNRCDGRGAILTIIQPVVWRVEPIC